jgi:hypothetical protein
MAEKHVANAAKLFDAVVIATIVDLPMASRPVL